MQEPWFPRGLGEDLEEFASCECVVSQERPDTLIESVIMAEDSWSPLYDDVMRTGVAVQYNKGTDRKEIRKDDAGDSASSFRGPICQGESEPCNYDSNNIISRISSMQRFHVSKCSLLMAVR